MHDITIEGTDQSYACSPDDTILRAGLRAGVGFPYECNVGSCGTCRFQLLEGEIEERWPEAPGLSARDRKKNRYLACQTRPLGACRIKVRPDPDLAPRHKPRKFEARLVGRRALTHDLEEFQFEAADAAAFLPGQYAVFDFSGVVGDRAFSMSNIANDQGAWQFQVKRVPGGAGTGFLFDELQVGQSVTIDGPYGMAYLREDSPRDIVCIAGGAGIAPMISIARGASKDAGGRPIHFFYGGREARDICGEDMLRALPGYGERIRYVAAISDPGPADDWRGARGFIHDVAREALVEDLTSYDFYFAGPPPMVEATLEMLVMKARVPYEQVHFDRFY